MESEMFQKGFISNGVKPSCLVIGIGNRYRADDQAGPEVIRKLKLKLGGLIRTADGGCDAATLIEKWKDENWVIVVDAVSSGGIGGNIYRFEANTELIPASFIRCSTHGFGLAEAIELGRALGRLPERLIVYGIEGEDFSTNAGMSAEVKKAVVEVVSRIERDIAQESKGVWPYAPMNEAAG